MKGEDYEIKPHINGLWKVVCNEKIDVTCKDTPGISKGHREYLTHPITVFTGSLSECQKIKDAHS